MPVPWGKKSAAPAAAQQPDQNVPPADEAHAQMEAKVKSSTPDITSGKRVGRWSLETLRQTDGIVPLQSGTNRFDSQKGMTGMGTIRNTTTRIKANVLAEIPEEIALRAQAEVRPQSGTNRYDSQRGMVGFGTGRDVARESKTKHQNLADLPEEKLLLSEGIVRLQSGTNRYDSQKGMTGIGTSRRELTKMVDTKHPEYIIDQSIDQSTNPLQTGTNKFASQKGMTGFGTSRRETTKMIDTKHPEYSHEHPDPTTIPSQMGSNKYASQKGMTGFGQPRWECLGWALSHQQQVGQGMVPSQMGSNMFASQRGMTGFGTPRNNTYESEAGEIPFDEYLRSQMIIPSQAGWNRGDSQKKMTSFGAPRDVKGKHLKRIWELEYPEEAEAPEINRL